MDNKVDMSQLEDRFKVGGRFYVEAYRDGKLLFKELIQNMVVNTGLQKAIDDTLLNGSQSANWYVGLLGNATPLAGWTMTEAGANEFTDYDNSATRPAWSGARTAQTASNVLAKAQFTIDTDSSDIYGAFLSTNNVKGGTTGTLFSAGLFAAARTGLMDNDDVYITYEVEAQST